MLTAKVTNNATGDPQTQPAPSGNPQTQSAPSQGDEHPKDEKESTPEVNLSGALLQSVNVRNEDLRGINFQGANLTRAILISVKLNGVNLRLANLLEAYLYWADLRGANLREAKLRGLREWKSIQNITLANIHDIQDAPKGFREWALKNGAVEEPNIEKWHQMKEK